MPCPLLSIVIVVVAGVGQHQCLRFSLGTGISLLMWYRGDFLMKKWAKSKKYGKETFLTFPLPTLLSIAVRVGRMKVVFPHSVWGQRYESWQGRCIRIWLEKIKEKNQRKKWEIYFSLCAHYHCSLLLLAVERQPWRLHIQSGGWDMNHGMGVAYVSNWKR